MKFFSLLYKKSIIPLAIIAISSATLSIVTYYYSLSVADTISDVASEDIRSNAVTQAHDLSLILTNGVDSITTNLQILSSSPAIQNTDRDARILFDVSQNSTSQLTHFYMWLDQEGQVQSVTNTGIIAENYVGLDRSYREYFTVPQSTLKPYFSGITVTSDNIPRLYIAYPIIDKNAGSLSPEISQSASAFRGVALASIGLDNIGNLLKQSSPSELQRNDVLLIDSDGVIIYARDSWLIGKNIIQDKEEITNSNLADKVQLDSFATALEQTKTGVPFMTDFNGADGKLNTLSSEPIILDGRRVWTVYVIAPHTLTADVRTLFDQQNVFSTLIVTVFGALAFGIAFLILGSNRRLGLLVDVKTGELRSANESLEDSNRKLASLNEQLLSANAQLQINDRLQKEFINVASHEMKTPTQAILLHSDIVKRKPQNAKESIDAIVRNAERLQKLTGNILDVTRIESRTLKLEKEKIALKDLIIEVLNDYKKQQATDKVIIEFSRNLSKDGDDVFVEADKSRLIQVVTNLLENAIEFTKKVVIGSENEGGNHIQVLLESKDGQATVSISDCGPGIDAEIMPRLFSKFATKSDKGTGLGLFISKSIIEAHGGRIWAENNKSGKGAIFAFTIPSSNSI